MKKCDNSLEKLWNWIPCRTQTMINSMEAHPFFARRYRRWHEIKWEYGGHKLWLPAELTGGFVFFCGKVENCGKRVSRAVDFCRRLSTENWRQNGITFDERCRGKTCKHEIHACSTCIHNRVVSSHSIEASMSNAGKMKMKYQALSVNIRVHPFSIRSLGRFVANAPNPKTTCRTFMPPRVHPLRRFSISNSLPPQPCPSLRLSPLSNLSPGPISPAMGSISMARAYFSADW